MRIRRTCRPSGQRRGRGEPSGLSRFGPFDLISCNATLERVSEAEHGGLRSLFVHPFTHVREHEMMRVHAIARGEGGDQEASYSTHVR